LPWSFFTPEPLFITNSAAAIGCCDACGSESSDSPQLQIADDYLPPSSSRRWGSRFFSIKSSGR
jgi:hypothetical protein